MVALTIKLSEGSCSNDKLLNIFNSADNYLFQK